MTLDLIILTDGNFWLESGGGNEIETAGGVVLVRARVVLVHVVLDNVVAGLARCSVELANGNGHTGCLFFAIDMGLADFGRQLSKLNRQVLHGVAQANQTVVDQLSLLEVILELQNEGILKSLQVQLALVELTLPVKDFRGFALQVHDDGVTLCDHLVGVVLVLLHLVATNVFELVGQLILNLNVQC